MLGVFITGYQLVPLEGPRALCPLCRDEDQAPKLWQLGRPEEKIVKITLSNPLSFPHPHNHHHSPAGSQISLPGKAPASKALMPHQQLA